MKRPKSLNERYQESNRVGSGCIASKFIKKGDILFREGRYINGILYQRRGL
mgnify:CR=1 FL=1